MKRNKKIVIFLVFILSFSAPLSSLAFTFSVGVLPASISIDVNEILQEINSNGLSSVARLTEDRYGFTNDIWRTAKRKVSAPRVEIFFDNTNPKVGEKVTAHAVPEFFKNDPQNLYYTWYIIHTRNGNIETATNSISDGKKEAAAVLSHGDYDPDLDGQNYPNPSDNPDQDGWPAIEAGSYDEDDVAAPMGGADGVGGLAEGNDSIEPYDDATEYCNTRGSHTLSACNVFTAKSSFNQYYNLQPDQSGDFCTACEENQTFLATLSPSGSPIGSVNDPNNTCCYSIAYPGGDPVYDPNVSYCPTSHNSAYEACYDYAGLQTYNSGLITSCLDAQFQDCEDDWDELHKNPSGDEPVGNVSRCYKHNFGTNNPSLGFRGYSGDSNAFSDDDSGTDIVTDCVHKWKDATQDGTNYTSGSGKFPTGEEKYWGTDPLDPDTDGDGFPDEADVVGLGQDSFIWNYLPGDRVGVVVEGTSMIPVDEVSAYYKIMWGYPDICDSTKTGLMGSDECNESDDFGFGYLATKSPSEQGEDKLKISLTFTPDNPLADPSDENSENILSDGTISDADQISVTSSLDNTNYNPAELYYTWQISKGDPQKDDWSEMKNISENFSTLSPAAGMGITQFSFSPKKDALSENSDINYFKVTLTANKASDQTAGRGRSSVIIPVNTKGVKITLHKVDVINGKATVGEEVCTDGLYRSLCPVVHGQMLAAKVSGSHYKSSESQFSWKVNGNSAYQPANASALFDGWNNTTIFFPITKEEQEIENISVTATSRDELQPATGARLATVVHPALFIKSGDTSLSWPKIYTAEDPDRKAVYQNIESSDAFEALTGSDASYYLDFVPYYLLGEDVNSTIDWSVNGTSIRSVDFYENNPFLGLVELENSDRTIKLPIGDTEGNFATLSASVKKYWDDDERLISYSSWGVAPDTLAGETSISIESVNSAGEDTLGAASTPGQILAAIGTHLPHYFMYLLRLVLTLAVMFVASAGLYGLTQKLSLADEKE